MRKILLGTTYSHRHARCLRLNLDTAFDELLNLRFDIIRLGCYWDELQVEPWEKDEKVAFSDNPPSMNPEQFMKNFEQVLLLRPVAFLFWGYEYWFWRKQQNDARMMDIVKELIAG